MAYLSKASRILIVVVICVLLVISIILSIGLTGQVTLDNEQALCSKCHQMLPQISTWQESSHKKVACTKCHTESSVFAMFLRSRAGDNIITTNDFINDKVCLECHTTDRTVTPPKGLEISHSLHMSKGVDCTDCHRDMAHAVKELVAFGNRIPMETCMKCHNGVKAPENCDACHSNKPIPENHSINNWNSNHGKAALTCLKDCNMCHEYDVAKQQTAKVTANDMPTLQSYARTNNFCIDCHGQRPPGHNAVYSVAHNKYALANKEFCLVCHNWDANAELPNPPSSIICTSCHVALTHPENWVNIHKDKAKSKDAESCFSCHDQNSCTKCHSSRGVNLAQ